MKFNYNVAGSDRKQLVAAISEILEVPQKYLGAPTFAYEVDYITIDKNGTVSFDDRAHRDKVEKLADALLKKGFKQEPCFEDLHMPEEEELGLGRQRRDPICEDGMQPSDVPDTDEGTDALTISLPRTDFPDATLENLRLLIASKETLIKKALSADALPIEVSNDAVSFPWFKRLPDQSEITAYAHFIAKLVCMAKTQKRITAKEKETDNEKYAFRCFLLRLGFIGDEFKTDRKILLRNLAGSGAFKSGNPKAHGISLQEKEVAGDEVSE
ncbi:MAG: virulence protein [Proteobacteria bacterium]|nr:virulence protein [Pseudomonadota bacterium]